jgi:hypothetical protein
MLTLSLMILFSRFVLRLIQYNNLLKRGWSFEGGGGGQCVMGRVKEESMRHVFSECIYVYYLT